MKSSLKTSLLSLLSLLLVSAAGLSARADYKQKAEEQTDYIQSRFFDAKTNRYHPDYPLTANRLPWEFMWGNGVQFEVLAGATRVDPAKYKPLLYAFREGLQSYWDPEAPVPGFNAYCSGPRGTDKYYDDNEWLVLGFAEAYETTHDKLFLEDARRTQKFVLSGWDDILGGGIYWHLKHQSKNTCSNGPAAASCLRLVQVAGDNDQMEWAKKIRAWVTPHLQDPADGLYWDGMNVKTGSIGKTKWTYNTALMIRTNVLFYTLTGDKETLAEARRCADAGLAAWTDPATGSFHKTEDSPLFTHLFGEALIGLYEATKDVKYLNAVRREASFAYRTGRDTTGGGYWSKWTAKEHKPDERKTLILNAAAARMFWLLAPYPDVEELIDAGKKAAANGDKAKAEDLFRQATASDPESLEARQGLQAALRVRNHSLRPGR